MECLEGLCSCTSRDGLQHGGLHLEETSFIEEGTHISQDTSTLSKDLAYLRVHDEIYIPLAKPCLNIR